MKILITIALLFSTNFVFAGTQSVKASTEKRIMQYADVDHVEYIKGQDVDVKVFSYSGGDPAMNGAYLNLAIFTDISTGWNVFELANVRNFQVLPSAKKGYLKLSLSRDTMNDNGDIVQESSILYINILNGASGTIETEEVK